MWARKDRYGARPIRDKWVVNLTKFCIRPIPTPPAFLDIFCLADFVALSCTPKSRKVLHRRIGSFRNRRDFVRRAGGFRAETGFDRRRNTKAGFRPPLLVLAV